MNLTALGRVSRTWRASALRGDLGERRHVVGQRGDVVEQGRAGSMPRGLLHAETGGLRHVTSHADFVADEFTHVRGSSRERLGTLRE
jgi:hypothetical protein